MYLSLAVCCYSNFVIFPYIIFCTSVVNLKLFLKDLSQTSVDAKSFQVLISFAFYPVELDFLSVSTQLGTGLLINHLS